MNTGIPKLLEAHFGPESDLINVADFVKSALEEQSTCIQHLERQWSAVSDDRRALLANECSIQELKDTLESTWDDPTLSSFLLKEHDRIAVALHPDKNKSGRSARRSYFPAPDTLPLETRILHQDINNIQLSSWTFPLSTSAFLRTSRNSDQNASDSLKFDTSSQAAIVKSENEAVVVISVFSKVPWSPCYVSRLSQHAFLASQTLQDICRTVPCAPYAVRVATNSLVQNYGIEDNRTSRSVICIEETAYGDGQEDDYAKKLVDHLAAVSKSNYSIQRALGSLSETAIFSLSLRINEPYWMLHRGNCEHFIVVEQIRALHPSDPRSGYPITLQQTPQMLDICRACEKSPAVWSIVNDIRLGESPSFLCAPCWSNMGLPDDSESGPIEIIPLLAYVP